jgi:hypothetical protein
VNRVSTVFFKKNYCIFSEKDLLLFESLYYRVRIRNHDYRKKVSMEPPPNWGSIGSSKARISCHYMHFAQTEDIGLKSAPEGKRGSSLIIGKTQHRIRPKKPLFPLPALPLPVLARRCYSDK